jgi:hypothetical protein
MHTPLDESNTKYLMLNIMVFFATLFVYLIQNIIMIIKLLKQAIF